MACLFLAGLIAVEHLAFGGNRADLSLLFAVLDGAALAAALLSPSVRRGLARLDGLRLPAILFAFVLAIGLVSLTPIPFGPNPIWRGAPGPGAVAVDPQGVVMAMVRLAGLGCLFLLAGALATEAAIGRFLARALVGGGLVFAMVALAMHVLWPGSIYGVPKFTAVDRLTGAFISANSAATAFAVVVVLSAAGIFQQQRQEAIGERASAKADRLLRRAGLEIAALGASVAALVLTASRTGLVAAVCMLVALATWDRLAHRKKGVAGVRLVAFVVVAGLAVGGGLVLQRFAGLGGDWAMRALLFRSHWRAIVASPWLGYGLGSFPSVNRLVMDIENFPDLKVVGALHSVYLYWLEQVGVMGAVPMFAALGAVLAKIAAGAARRGRAGGWSRGVICASGVVLLHGLTDYALEEPSIAALWSVVLGLGFGLAQTSRRDDASESPPLFDQVVREAR